MYFVYVIFNKKHQKYYIGQTKDLINRLNFHNNGSFESSYTFRFDGEWQLVYKEELVDRKQALVREKQLKKFIPRWRNGSADPC